MGLRVMLFQPSLQDRVEGALAAGEAVTMTPLFDGPVGIMWAAAIGALLFFVVILALMMRGNMVRSAKYAKAAEAKFFQPAGDEAEITFDSDDADLVHDVDARSAPNGHVQPVSKDSSEFAEVIIERPDGGDDDLETLTAVDAPPKKKSGPFSGLFAKKKRPHTEPIVEHEFVAEEESEIAQDLSLDAEAVHDPYATTIGSLHDERSEIMAEEQRAARALTRRAEEEAEDIRRRAERDARRAEEEARRREEEASRRIAAEEARLAAEREAEFERRKRAAFEQQTASVDPSDIERSLTKKLDEKFSALSDRIAAAQGDRSATSVAPAFVSGGSAPQAAHVDETMLLMSQRFSEHRESVDATLRDMRDRLDLIAGAPAEMDGLRADIAELRGALGGRVSLPSAPTVQLADIVRNALPPDAYEMNAILPNNRKADCLITLPDPPGPVAIDAHFPIEDYTRYQRALGGGDHNEEAENEFRRAALRHVVNIAERLIIPEATAESALMFVPSESIYADLHARFSDVIQDSYRARVWIVSPTTLMATLHTVRAILRDAETRNSAHLIQEEAQHVLSEVDDLRKRVAALEENFDKTRSDVRDVVTSTDQVFRRAETITRTGVAMAQSSEPRADRPLIGASDAGSSSGLFSPAPQGEDA
ncbi:MAG: DNA recombination protein RmuC, partial [Pseudomonadota bacterium]